jgi:hypothetical protein
MHTYVGAVDGEKIGESVNDYNHISVLKLIIMKKNRVAEAAEYVQYEATSYE